MRRSRSAASSPPDRVCRARRFAREVGDLVEILFVNRLSTHYASMHSMGLSYIKENEGGVYGLANETVRGDAVPPNGGCWVYNGWCRRVRRQTITNRSLCMDIIAM